MNRKKIKQKQPEAPKLYHKFDASMVRPMIFRDIQQFGKSNQISFGCPVSCPRLVVRIKSKMKHRGMHNRRQFCMTRHSPWAGKKSLLTSCRPPPCSSSI